MAFNLTNKPYTIYCSRCGSEYTSDSRYCMKCGNLNPDHPQNKDVSKFIKKSKPSFIIGGGQTAVNVNANEVNGKAAVNVVRGDNTGNFDKCFLINALIYFGFVIAATLITCLRYGFDFELVAASNLCYILFPFSLIMILLFSLELVMMKLNRPWWQGLIPFYNNMVIADVLFEKPIIGALTIIPILGQLVQLYIWWKLGSRFKRFGLLTALFPLIMLPVIGFGGSAFDGVCYVSNDNTLEKEFKRKNFVLSGCILFIFISSAMFVYTNFDSIVNRETSTADIYFVMSAKIVEMTIDRKIENGEYKCKYSTNGVLYFHYYDISEYFFIPFASFFDPISATVRVENTPAGRIYYISMSNGVEGFPETMSSYITSKSVVPYAAVDKSYRKYGCKINS